MNAATIRIKLLHAAMGQTLALPTRMSEHAAGFDLCAAIDAEVTLEPGERRVIPCGFAMEMPAGYEAQVRSRSGLAVRHGVVCLNSPGTIDADYRGEVKVVLINHGQERFTMVPGMRIAQMVFATLAPVGLEVVHTLNDTARAGGGFGSTGV